MWWCRARAAGRGKGGKKKTPIKAKLAAAKAKKKGGKGGKGGRGRGGKGGKDKKADPDAMDDDLDAYMGRDVKALKQAAYMSHLPPYSPHHPDLACQGDSVLSGP